MLLITLMYKLVLVAVGFGLIIFGQGILREYFHGVLPIFGVGLFFEQRILFSADPVYFSPHPGQEGYDQRPGMAGETKVL